MVGCGNRLLSLGYALALALGTCQAGYAQSYSGGRVTVHNPVSFSTPITDHVQQEVQSNTVWKQPYDSGSGPYQHVVGQLDTTAAVQENIPFAVTRFEGDRPKPFDVDYAFFGRSGVDDPSTNVKMNELGISYRYSHPFFERLTITWRPFFDVLFLSGPGGPVLDVPEQLYKLALDSQWDLALNERWGLSFGMTPGFWTDFQHTTSDDTRLPLRLLATYRVHEGLVLAGGILYTDNIRRNLLPGIGAIWDVNERTRLELMWPRFRALYEVVDGWQVYGVFERGGDTYNIRTGQVSEDMEYRDNRLLLGLQTDYWSFASFFVETGVAFNRKFRFDIQPDVSINSSFFIRMGSSF